MPDGGGDLLEVGCGQGGFGVRLARRFRYVGIDPDATSAEIARNRFALHGVSGAIRTGDLAVIGADERFDIVCAFEVLEHLEHDVIALRQWSEKLRSGGTLIVSVPGWSRLYGSWDELAGHYRRYDPEALVAAFKAAGLQDVSASAYGWPLGYLLEATRRRVAGRRGTASAGASFEERTAVSGRLIRLPDGPLSAGPCAMTFPFMLLQRCTTRYGTSLIGIGRKLKSA